MTQNEDTLRAALSIILAAWDAKTDAATFASTMEAAMRNARIAMATALPRKYRDLTEAPVSQADIERFIQANGF